MKADRFAAFRNEAPCAVCAKVTDWMCHECAMYAGKKIWVCPSKDCQKIHNEMCGVAVAAN